MSIRGVWILRLQTATTPSNIDSPGKSDVSGRLLFSRFFPLVEKKVKILDKNNYIALPKIPEFISGLLFELGHKEGIDSFIAARDTCKKLEQKPVYEVVTSCGPIWPVVVVEQRGLIYCCVPLVSQGTHTRPPLIQIPGVTLGFSLLCGLADFLRPSTTGNYEVSLKNLNLYINTAAPFGTPVDTNYETVVSKMFNKPSVISKTQKQPAWKPVLHKGKNQVYIAITECIRAVQYNKESIPDVWDVYGTISCKAELEGALPDITLNISHAAESNSLALDHLLIHPCVQSADSAVLNMGDPCDLRPTSRRVRFNPPTEMFVLCHYTVSSLEELPIKGSYEMKMENRGAKVSVKLKMSENVRNAMEYCELQMPLYNRGNIGTFDSSCSQGSVMVSPDRKILVWNVGQKFPTKSLSASLEASVNFVESKSASAADDPFCVEQNAYAKLFFKIADFTHSGCYVDPKSVQVSPNVKFKLTTVQEYLSGLEYKIWNINGDALASTIPKSLLAESVSEIT